MVYLLDAWSDADCCLSLCVVQEVHSGRFAMYDYGDEKTNRQHYGVVSQGHLHPCLGLLHPCLGHLGECVQKYSTL